MIVSNAFSAENFKGDADPITGGLLGGLIVLGARRASFSNEAGIGTGPMALGATKSNEPVREGLVAMLSPAIDTLLVCTCTALAILVTGVWQTSESNGVTLTAVAFDTALPGVGHYILMVCIFFFSITSRSSYAYYGAKSTSFLLGAERGHWFNYFYLTTNVIGATASHSFIISVIDPAYALMAVPTNIAGELLAKPVMKEAKLYFKKISNR
jgi:AGCS family alanine or glycine:cation symporter